LRFAPRWQSYLGLRVVPENALEIDVIGQQYSWIFIYPNEKVVVDELVVPQGMPIKLNVTAEDVNHSLFIPAFRIKMFGVVLPAAMARQVGRWKQWE